MTIYDQKYQNVGKQFNVNFDLNSNPDPQELLNEGIQLLEAKSYQQAIEVFRRVITIDASISNAYFLLALALLKGKRPKVLNSREVEEIDQLLNAATTMGDSDGTVQWFRVLLRDDYYHGNGITKYPPPSINNLIETAVSCNTNINRLRALLVRLPMHDNKLYAALAEHYFS
ncbi:MAG: hypothetical protein QNJ47_14615 [Nostocaceae cyanobacterium]|nr:hypothetical protein [Nostocaceae cyanobacterium]